MKINQLALFVLLILLCACNRDPKPIELSTEEENFFSSYVNTHTSGSISRTSPIQFTLSKQAEKLKEGDKINPKLFSIKPSLDGELIWDGWRSFKFIPNEYLPVDQKYNVSVNLAEIFDDIPNGKNLFNFSFKSRKPTIYVYSPRLIPLDEADPTAQEIKGHFKVNDIVDEDAVKRTLTAKQNGKTLKISVAPSDNPKQYDFIISGVIRGEEESEVLLIYNGKPIGADLEREQSIRVSSLNDFGVNYIRAYTTPEQHVDIEFSDLLQEGQDLTGLIRFSNGTKFRSTKSGNLIKLYPTSRISGSVQVIVDQSIRNTSGYQLKNEANQSVAFTTLKPQVEALSAGVIMPTTDQGIVFPFKAVSLHEVQVKIIQIYEDNIGQFFQTNQLDQARELKRVGRLVHKSKVSLGSPEDNALLGWNDYAIDLADMMHAEPGAIYRVIVGFDQSMSVYPCETPMAVNTSINTSEDPEYEEYDKVRNYWDYYDDGYYYDDDRYYGEYHDPCDKRYFNGRGEGKMLVRNIISSDLGIIAKRSKNRRLNIAITDLKTTEPLSNVEVKLFNLQGKQLASKSTDSQGFVTIDFKSKPFYLEANHNGQVGYLKLDDGHSLSMSMFDVSGAEKQKGIKGLIYQERGVSRPGDSLYLTFILDDRANPLPSFHPVIMELYDPKGQRVEHRVSNDGVNNFYSFKTKTSVDAPTGNWSAKVKVGGASFSKTVKIETIKPNRLKINLDFPREIISANDIQPAALDVKWLHGAVAKNIKADVEMTLTSGNTKFDKYDEYSFDDQAKEFDTEKQMIFDANVDANGKASVLPKMNIGDEAPGMVNAYFKVRAFEDGGNFSEVQFKQKISPYQSYVGVKVPQGKGWRGAVYSDKDTPMSIVTLDELGNPINRDKLKVEIYDLSWSWWWERSNRNNIRNYVTDRDRNLLQQKTISSTDGKATYTFNLGRGDWGRKLVRVIDPISGHIASQIFYTSYAGWWSRGEANFPGAAEMLSFKTDKEDYTVGESIDLQLPNSKEGRALISIENGTEVLEEFWLEVNENNNTVTIPTTASMAPNAYVHVTLIQPHAQKVNDRPIRLYGVQRVNVVDNDTKLQPVLDVASELRPESDYEISVRESSGKPMTYTIAVVDDGILDLTRYRTPQPWNAMYAREALGVKTWDMYKDVMGAYGSTLTQLLALGGDEFAEGADKKKANRFKPVVSFLGPFELGKGGVGKHTLNMPNYVGSVRTMVVAGDPRSGAYGHVDQTSTVKKPLMVLATMPRVLSPEETLEVPISVFAMDKKVKNVKVTVESNDLLNFKSNSKSVQFSEIGDQIVRFPLTVENRVGIAKFKVTVSGAGETASEEIELDVRMPNPEVTRTKESTLLKGQEKSLTYDYFGVEGTNKGMLELSTIPSLNLEKRLQYLIRYPHGCIEQTTSAAFPQVYLPDLAKINEQQRIDIQNNVRAALNKLKTYQNTSGSFSYWPGNSRTNYWGTNYVGHFMIAAEEKGYSLPHGMKDSWLAYQRNTANNWSSNKPDYWNNQSWQLTQAYRLYTLALAGAPELGAMNRLRGRKDLSNASRWKLAGAYAIAGKPEVARELIASLPESVDDYRYHSYTYGSSMRDEAMILETYTEINERSKGLKIVKDLAEKLASGSWYSTHTTAYTLGAISRFIRDEQQGEQSTAKLKINNLPSIDVVMNKPIQLIDLPLDGKSTGQLSLNHTGGGELFIRVTTSGIPSAGNEVSANNNLTMKVKYSNVEGRPLNNENVPQGTDILAEVTVTNPGGYYTSYRDMALTQIFPAGWEIRNTRMDESTEDEVSEDYDYQDVRDDRVMTYFSLNKNEKKTFKVKLNATYAGRYYLPATQCEAMYDDAIHATQKGQWINVVQQ